ncbi:hypothetical protein UT300003_07580 [Clostridium sardiniense]
MSKLNIRLSYKNACILKHASRNQVKSTKIFLEGPEVVNFSKEYLDKMEKELKEEKRALAAMRKAMVNATECHGYSWYKQSSK